MIEKILDAGFDANTKDVLKKETALQKAAQQEHNDCVIFLEHQDVHRTMHDIRA